jgi:hypothetical protein
MGALAIPSLAVKTKQSRVALLMKDECDFSAATERKVLALNQLLSGYHNAVTWTFHSICLNYFNAALTMAG